METGASSIVQVELLIGPEEQLQPVENFFVDEKEVLNFTDTAVSQFTSRARRALGDRAIKRLLYKDDEDDWCSLMPETLADAMDFAEPSPGDSLRRLKLRIVADPASAPAVAAAAVPAAAALSAEPEIEQPEIEQPTPAAAFAPPPRAAGDAGGKADVDMTEPKDGKEISEDLKRSLEGLCDRISKMPEDAAASGASASASASIASGSVEAAATAAPPPAELHLLALEQLNQLAADVDLRRLVPKLAAAGLRIIEEVQFPQLFPLLDLLCAFRDGFLKAESVPGVIPQFAEAVKHLPAEEQALLLMRFKEEAEKATSELREEQAREGSREVEVHPNVICDGCDTKPIIGNRYKSLENDDFDLCKACYDREARDPKLWVRVTSDIMGSVVGSYYGASPAESMSHPDVECDGCGMYPIKGKRFKCLDLDDFDLCQACKAHSDAVPETAARRFKEVLPNTCAISGPALEAFQVVEASAAADRTPEEEEEEEEAEETVGVQATAPLSEVEDVKAVEAALAEFDTVALKTCLSALLRHPSKQVRQAAGQAVRRCSSGCGGSAAAASAAAAAAEEEEEEATEPKAKEGEKEEEMKIDAEEQTASERADTGDEWDMMVAHSADDADTKPMLSDEAQPEAEGPSSSKNGQQPQRGFSARVMGSAPLVLGVEAEEVPGAQGDATEEFGPLVAQCGARQAFRIARVVVPAGEGAATVPACAKIVVVNDGEAAWPKTAAVALVAGDSLGFPHLQLDAMKPGEAAEIEMDLMLPAKEAPCSGRSVWALVDASTGVTLGPLLFFETAWVGQ